MATLIYSAITSLDGYTADTDGRFDWAAPDDEVHAFVNNLERPIGIHLHADAVRQMKTDAQSDISVGGPALAAQAIWTGLVDECHLFVTPVIVGGGTRSLPDGVRQRLELLDEHRFGNGVVYLRYGTTT